MTITMRMAAAAVLAGAALQAAASAAAPDTASVLGRVEADGLSSMSLVDVAFANPAMKPLQRGYSMSRVEGSCFSRSDGGGRAIDPQQGSGSRHWAFNADSYMKYKGSTLWGAASYRNGKDLDVRWNETSELPLVYPYVMADSIGGDIKKEIYSFSGGYASSRGPLGWGGAMGYTAGLYYRAVDPRPRNVTGNLRFSLGGTYRFGGCTAGLMLGYAKYKQTNEVDFYSELGSRRLLHLTGPVSDYGRFAGDAADTYYNGNTFVLGLNLATAGGLVLSAEAVRYTLTNVLSSLNNLPMAHTVHSQLRAEAAWVGRSGMGAVARLLVSRRKGTENVFGDASAAVFPKIAERNNYFENRVEASLRGMASWRLRSVSLTLTPAAGYTHRNQIYRDPRSRDMVNSLWGSADVRASWRAGRLLLTANAAATYCGNVGGDLLLATARNELQPLAVLVADRHYVLASDSWTAAAGLRADVALGKAYALRLRAQWQRTAYTAHIHSSRVTVAAGVVF